MGAALANLHPSKTNPYESTSTPPPRPDNEAPAAPPPGGGTVHGDGQAPHQASLLFAGQYSDPRAESDAQLVLHSEVNFIGSFMDAAEKRAKELNSPFDPMATQARALAFYRSQKLDSRISPDRMAAAGETFGFQDAGEIWRAAYMRDLEKKMNGGKDPAPAEAPGAKPGEPAKPATDEPLDYDHQSKTKGQSVTTNERNRVVGEGGREQTTTTDTSFKADDGAALERKRVIAEKQDGRETTRTTSVTASADSDGVKGAGSRERTVKTDGDTRTSTVSADGGIDKDGQQSGNLKAAETRVREGGDGRKVTTSNLAELHTGPKGTNIHARHASESEDAGGNHKSMAVDAARDADGKTHLAGEHGRVVKKHGQTTTSKAGAEVSLDKDGNAGGAMTAEETTEGDHKKTRRGAALKYDHKKGPTGEVHFGEEQTDDHGGRRERSVHLSREADATEMGGGGSRTHKHGDVTTTTAASAGMRVGDDGKVAATFHGDQTNATNHGSRTTSATVQVNDGQVSGDGGISDETHDANGNRRTRAAKVARDQNGTEVSGSTTAERHDGNTTTTSSHGASARIGDDGKVRGGYQGSEGSETVVDGKTTTTSRSAGATYGDKGLALNAQDKRAEKSEGHDASVTRSASYEDGKATFARTTSTNDDQKEKGKSASDSATKVTVSGDSVLVGHDTTRTTTNSDGTSTANKVGVTANVLEGQGGASFSHANKDSEGKTTSSLDANATIELNRNLDLEGASAKIGYTQGDHSVSVFGGFKVSAKPEMQKDGSWLVRWQASESAGGALGTSKSSEGGAKIGANVAGEAGRTMAGVQHCRSKEEADAFAASAAKHLRSELKQPIATAEEALAMNVGDTRVVDDHTKGTLGVNGSAEGVSANASIGGGTSDKLEVVKVANGVVEVTLEHTGSKNAAGSLGTTGVKMGASGRAADSEQQVARFDLTTAEGKHAYQEFTLHHRLVDDKYKVADSTEKLRGTGHEVDVLGAHAETEGVTRHKATHDRQGHTTLEDEGSRSAGLALPLGLGSFKHKVGIDSVEVDGGQRQHTLRGMVSTTEGQSSMKELGQFAGIDGAMESGKVKSSGTWSTSASIGDSDLDHFSSMMVDGSADLHQLQHFRGAGEDLAQGLRSAKTPNERVQLIDKFIAASGGEGAEFLRKQAGIKLDTDLELRDDKGKVDQNFQGAAWRQNLEGKLLRYCDALSSPTTDKRDLVHQIVADIQGLMERRAGLTDPDAYSDLPRALRAQEIARTDSWLTQLRGLQTQAQTQVRGDTRAPDAFGPPTAGEAKEQRDNEELAELESKVEASRARFDSAQKAVVTSRWIHDGAMTYGGGSARHQLGEKGLLWDDPEQKSYAAADNQYAGSKLDLHGAQVIERELVADRAAYNMATTPLERATHLGKLRSRLNALALRYTDAAKEAGTAETGYQAIRGRHTDQEDFLFRGYEKEKGNGPPTLVR